MNNGKTINLIPISVQQGNGNGKSITYSHNQHYVLKTSDLVDCIAVLIIDKNQNKLHMIHSDSHFTSGVGGVSLRTAFRRLDLSSDIEYSIGLIGGQSNKALDNMENHINNLLPQANISHKQSQKENAYLVNDGTIASSKIELSEKLGVGKISLMQLTSSNTQLVFSKITGNDIDKPINNDTVNGNDKAATNFCNII
ncbi:MAG: hypothetical protein GY782_00910 [Gammaproteobacteria bacterium]|nr:hypothetical protein [Gammaproteobacteria bacterium]